MSSFVLGSIVIGSPADASVPGVPVDWNVNNSTQLVASIVPDPQADPDSEPYNFVGGSYANDVGTDNFVVRLGHNITAGGGAVDAARPYVADEWEQDYYNPILGPGRYVERHLSFKAPGEDIQRVWTFGGRWDAEPATPAQNQLGFNVDSIYHYNRDRTDQYWTVDGVYGMQFTNIPFGTNNTETTAEHLIIRGPAAQTTPFITVAQNGITCISVNSKAEMFIDGSSVGAGAGGTAMLQVRGRVGTSLSVLFEDRNAQPIFSIAGDGSYTLNNGLLLQRNSISVQTSGGVETFAVVNSSGIIRTNQTAAATTPGSVTHKMPIYDTSGTLVGYIPIYNAIT